jgi:hypothetical protein
MKSIYKLSILFSILILLVVGFLYYFSQNDIYNWRLNLQLQQVETKEYKGLAPNIAFEYSTIFEIDGDANGKYGQAYIAGIKLKTDNRTGCDIRINGPQLDFIKTENELAQEVTAEISKQAKNFKVISKEKMFIDGNEAFKITFSFKDPLGSRIMLEQVFVSNNKLNYFIICGTGEQQYDFFRKDFKSFFNSITFDVDESDFIN